MSSAPGAPAKVCIKCGQDCSNKPRTKDPQGGYTCKECFDKREAAAPAKPAPKPAAKPAPVESTDIDPAMAALLKDSGGGTLTETCPSCGSGLASGAVLCTICGYNKETGKTMRTGKALGVAPGEQPTAGSVVKKVALAPVILLLSAAGGAVGGLIGAAIWAAVAYNLHVAIGWIAWGVGALVGVGTITVARNRAGALTGLIAAVIGIISVLGGKFWTASMLVDDYVKSHSSVREQMHHAVTDDELIAFLAHAVVAKQEEAGITVKWPDGADPDEAEHEADFPPGVWKEARANWDSLEDSEKDDLRRGIQQAYNEHAQDVLLEAKSKGFVSMFHPLDILWILLAAGSAFSIGSGAKTAKESAGAS